MFDLFNNPATHLGILLFVEFWACGFFVCLGFYLLRDAVRCVDSTVTKRLACVALGIALILVGMAAGIHLLLLLDLMVSSGH